jgi:hypothetical protein
MHVYGKFLIGIGMILVVVALYLYINQDFQNKSPRLLKERFVDLGKVYVDHFAEKTLYLQNNFSKKIELISATPTCTCVNIHLAESTIKSHQSIAAIVGTWGNRPLGLRRVQINLEWRVTGSAEIRKESFVAQFEYVSSMKPEFQLIDFGRILVKEASASKDIDLYRGNINSDWDGLEVVTGSTNIGSTVSIGQKTAHLKIYLHPIGLRNGYYNSFVNLFPTKAGRRTGDKITIPVKAQLEATNFLVEPSVIHFDIHQTDGPVNFTFRLNAKEEPLSSLSFSCIPPVIDHWKVQIDKSGKNAVIYGVLHGEKVGAVFAGKVAVEPNGNPIEIFPVSFWGSRM